MRPGQLNLNALELAILERLAKTEPTIRGSLEHLHVSSREFTGVGSFTNFKCDVSTDDAAKQDIGLDAVIEMPGVPNGLGAVLFLNGGKPVCLELFTYGDDHWDGVFDGFSIEASAQQAADD